MKRRSTKPGSRANELENLVKAESARLGRGLSIEEIRASWSEHHPGPLPKALSAEVFSLVRRGVLVRVAGRVGSSLYAHPESAVPTGSLGGDAEQILAALRSLHKRVRRPVSTREVAGELERLCVKLVSGDPNVIRKRLGSLAEGRKRGLATAKAPKVRRIAGLSVSGRPSAYWEPAGAESSRVPAPRSRADAVRIAIGAATEALGRPVSRTELRWWVEAHPTHPAAEILRTERLSADLADTVKADARYSGDERRAHGVATTLSCHGGAPERYTLGPPRPDDVAVCSLLDALYAYQPAEERVEIGVLRVRADMLDEPELHSLADTRERVLARALRDAVGVDIISLPINTASHALSVQEQWFAGSRLSANQRDKRAAYLLQARAALDAASRLPVASDAEPLKIIGEAASVEYPALAPFAESTGRLVDLEAERAPQLLARARRLPVPEPIGSRRFGPGTPEPLSRLDRVDALLACLDAVPLARTSVLINEARALLGRVLRDAEPLRGLLGQSSIDPVVRRAAIVALGLLGEPIALGEAVPVPSNPDDTVAYVLWAVLALGEEAYDPLRDADLRATAAARSVTDDARRRFDGGDLVCVLG